jgi:flagellar FliJ protein
MARFVFRLEAVLDTRRLAEQQRQRELAEVSAQMVALQNELRALNETADLATSDIRQNRLIGQLDMAFIAAHRRYMGAVQRKALELVQRMALVQRQLDQARAALGEAAKQRKIIERLREKQLARWRAEISRKELEQLDEVSMQLHRMKQLSEAGAP